VFGDLKKKMTDCETAKTDCETAKTDCETLTDNHFIDQQYVFDHLPLNKDQRKHLYEVLLGLKQPSEMPAVEVPVDAGLDDTIQHREQLHPDTVPHSPSSSAPPSNPVLDHEQAPPELERLCELHL
jgi:hypothetical protein